MGAPLEPGIVGGKRILATEPLVLGDGHRQVVLAVVENDAEMPIVLVDGRERRRRTAAGLLVAVENLLDVAVRGLDAVLLPDHASIETLGIFLLVSIADGVALLVEALLQKPFENLDWGVRIGDPGILRRAERMNGVLVCDDAPKGICLRGPRG